MNHEMRERIFHEKIAVIKKFEKMPSGAK